MKKILGMNPNFILIFLILGCKSPISCNENKIENGTYLIYDYNSCKSCKVNAIDFVKTKLNKEIEIKILVSNMSNQKIIENEFQDLKNKKQFLEGEEYLSCFSNYFPISIIEINGDQIKTIYKFE